MAVSTFSIVGSSPVFAATTMPSGSNIKLTEDIYLSSAWQVSGNVTIDLNGHTITRNLSSKKSDGEVIYVKKNANLVINDSVGTGKITGGYSSNGGSVKNNNTGSNYGGGIYVSDDYHIPLIVKGGTISNNTATTSGGGVYIQDGAVNFTSSSSTSKINITNNYAGKEGGGIYCNDNDGTTISDVNFSGNTAKTAGSGVYINTDNTVFGNINIENNTSALGGGMYVDSNNKTTIKNKVVIRNNKGYNLYLASDNRMKLGTLTAGSEIGAYVNTSSMQITGEQDIALLNPKYFFSARSGYEATTGNYSSDGKKAYLIFTKKTSTVPDKYTVDNVQYELKRGEFKHPSPSDHSKDISAVYYYSDGYFMQSGKIYNEYLATMSMCLAMAAFNSNEGGSDYTNKSLNLRSISNSIGFDDLKINQGFQIKPTRNTIGIGVSHRTLPDGSILLPIAIRGTNYDTEWASNVLLGASGEAQGFNDATTQSMEFVQQYNRRL